MSDPDIRQGELKEGAGLDESRLNTEFIDNLQKYASPVLFGLAGIVLAWMGWGRLQSMQNSGVNAAWRDYSDVVESANPSPSSLRVVAEEHAGVGTISLQTRLREADVYLTAVKTNLVPGATPLPGEDVAEEDRLTPEDRATYLDDAERLYRRVIDETGDLPGEQLHAIGARFGLAAVLEERGDVEGANGVYEELATRASSAGFERFAEIARQRMAETAEAVATGDLPAREDLPASEPVGAPGVESPVLVPGLDLGGIDGPAPGGEIDSGDVDSGGGLEDEPTTGADAEAPAEAPGEDVGAGSTDDGSADGGSTAPQEGAGGG